MPVYLYEDAARLPERRRLEDIRRGQFEGLAEKMRDPAWQPDFGPARPHPTAGASVIGARMPLIAYNINLDSDRLDVARSIASVIRESSGGLPCVKAMGVPLDDRGIVQVSMNLTNYTITSMRTVFDAVESEASSLGIDILESELIGLVPAAALADTSPEYLRIAGLPPRHDPGRTPPPESREKLTNRAEGAGLDGAAERRHLPLRGHHRLSPGSYPVNPSP